MIVLFNVCQNSPDSYKILAVFVAVLSTPYTALSLHAPRSGACILYFGFHEDTHGRYKVLYMQHPYVTCC